MSSEEHVAQLDALMTMMLEAGLELVHSQFGGCGAELGLSAQAKSLDDAPDRFAQHCLPRVEQAGWPCRLTCQNLLFARLAPAAGAAAAAP